MSCYRDHFKTLKLLSTPSSSQTSRPLLFPLTSGMAQMVLGNHEINLLKGYKKHGNRWYSHMSLFPHPLSLSPSLPLTHLCISLSFKSSHFSSMEKEL